MTTLIAAYVGKVCIGRCDAKCYDAKHSDCNCICGGRNHNKTLDEAFKNTRENSEEWLKQFSLKKQVKKVVGQVNPDVFQFSLFE